MNVSEPEADTEYSRAPAGSGAGGRRPCGRPPEPPGSPSRAAPWSPAVLLFVSEFLPLFEVRTSARNAVTRTVVAGSHHAYGLIPIAVLAVALAVRCGGVRPAGCRRWPWPCSPSPPSSSRSAATCPTPRRRASRAPAGTYVTAAASPRRGPLPGDRGGRHPASRRRPAGSCSARVRRGRFRPFDLVDGPLADLEAIPTVYQHQARYIYRTRGLSYRSPRSRAVGSPRVSFKRGALACARCRPCATPARASAQPPAECAGWSAAEPVAALPARRGHSQPMVCSRQAAATRRRVRVYQR